MLPDFPSRLRIDFPRWQSCEPCANPNHCVTALATPVFDAKGKIPAAGFFSQCDNKSVVFVHLRSKFHCVEKRTRKKENDNTPTSNKIVGLSGRPRQRPQPLTHFCAPDFWPDGHGRAILSRDHRARPE